MNPTRKTKTQLGPVPPLHRSKVRCGWMAEGASVLMQGLGVTPDATRALCAAQQGRGAAENTLGRFRQTERVIGGRELAITVN